MKHVKRILLILPALIVTMMITCGVTAYAADPVLNTTDDIRTITVNGSYKIIDGVTEQDLTLNKSDGTSARAHVILVEYNAKAKFRAVTPGYYTSGSTKSGRASKAAAWKDSDWKSDSVSDMAAEYESASDTSSVLAAINGDFGISYASGGAPRGTLILEGTEIAHSSEKVTISGNTDTYPAEDEFFFGYRTDGSLNIVSRTTDQKNTFTEAICGAAFILRNGETFGVDGETDSRQRTGVAIKTDGSTLLITVESGITVKQLAELMKSSGCINGINMDGGGSTTMITRRSGETKTTRRTPEIADSYSDKDTNGERKVTSALMLVSDSEGPANTAWAGNTTTITTDKDTYEIGEPIYVTARSKTIRPWVGLYKTSDTPGTDGSFYWYYINGVSDTALWCWNNGGKNNIYSEGYGNDRSDFETGQYKLIAFSGDDYAHPLAESGTITLKAPADDPSIQYSLELSKSAYEVGEMIEFKATSPKAHTWVGLYKREGDSIPGTNSFFYYDLWKYDQGDFHYLNGGSSIEQQRADHSIGAGLPAGEYKAILFETYDGDTAYSQKVVKNFTIYDPDETYTITYMNGDQAIKGLTPSTYKYSADSDIALPGKTGVEDTVKGYTFSGWYADSECTGSAITTIPKGSLGNKTFYGKFKINNYTVTFDTDGGTEIAPQTVKYGDCAVEPDEPEKEEMVFLGWTTTKGGAEAFDFNVPITGDTTVYASWGEKGYIITFDTQGGSPVNKQTVKTGGKAKQPGNPKRDGYRFMGWVTEAGGSTKFDFGTEITGDTTIYASWRIINYSITYDLDGGAAGEAEDNPTTYNVETPTFTLKDPSKKGYVFAGWMDEEGNIVEKINQGSFGDLKLTAQWSRETSLTTDRDEYVDGQALRVTAYCENSGSWIGLYKEGDVPGTSDLSFYWSWVTDGDGKPVISGEEINLLDPSYKNEDNSKPLEYGTYRVILFGDSGYNELLSKTITIKENTENPLKGSLEIAGYSRDDKKYSGDAKAEKGRTLYEYFYGDDISVKAEVSGLGEEDVWVGVIADKSDMTIGGTTIADHWYWIKDYNGKSVSLNYMASSEINEENSLLPFGLNYWVVMVSGSGKVLAAEPFNFRTYNMDWNNVEWGESAKKNIKVELEWTTKLANGEEQKPSLKLTRINGLFGYKKDSSGNLEKITEEVLKQGKDYTVSYPAKSVDPGSYTIEVTFPSAQPSGDDSQSANDYYKYLSTNEDNYGFKSGVKYYLTEKEGQHIITYELNGGVNNAGNPELFSKGEEIELLAPSKKGCIFEGWYTTPDFKDGTLIEKLPANLDEDITVYARWADEHTAAYKITYVLNGGTNDPKNPDGYTGNTDLALRPAKKPRCNFEGWYFDAAFTKPADVIPKGTTGDLTVYAKFTKSEGTVFAITTSVIGGSISDNVKVKKGLSHTVVYEPNSGYVLRNIFVDGVAVDIKTYASSYTFENISADHTISVVFAKKESSKVVKKGAAYTVGSQKYKVTKVASSGKYGEVTFTKAKNKKSVTVPATVKLKDGKTYKVTAIAAKAFNKKKIRTITIGKNIKKINKYAFKSSKATKLIVKTKLLKKTTVKGSLKNSKIKTIQMKLGKKKFNKTYVKKYKKIFTKKNAGRKVSVK